jgi:hypothetical protein
MTTSGTHIGSLNEKSLHASLKAWYRQPGDRVEVAVDGFVIDLVRDDLLIEIQTGNFSAIKRKMTALTHNQQVRLIYPVAREKWIVRQDAAGEPVRRRKSPKRETCLHMFTELVSFPHLMTHANFSLEVVAIQEEEVRRFDKRRGWRRHGWVTHERHLLQVLEHRLFSTPADCGKLLPAELPDPFTTKDLAQTLDIPRWLAQKMAYCLHKMGTLVQQGKHGNARLYVLSA